MGLGYDQVAEIIKIINSSACEELILETSDLKLVVRRRGAGPLPEGGVPPALARTSGLASGPAPDGASAPRISAVPPGGSPAARIEEAAPSQGSAKDSALVEVRAPMVGTFYRAPSPEAPPFVEVGSEVRTGQPLGVIEVMKLFTTIFSETTGRLVQVCAENNELVEYGRVLFVIEESR